MSEEAIAAVASQLFHVGGGDAAEPDVVPNSPEPAVAPEPQVQDTAILGEPVPDEVALDLADDEEEIEDFSVEPEEDPVVAEGDEYEDPEIAKLKRELVKARKRADHLEKQRITQGRKQWEAEAKKFWPLADVNSITATSRRQFRKQAAAQHEARLPVFQSALEAEKKRLREEAAAQWGRPVSGGAITPDAVANTVEVEKARKRGLAAAILEMGKREMI